jgi:hypothetical protein
MDASKNVKNNSFWLSIKVVRTEFWISGIMQQNIANKKRKSPEVVLSAPEIDYKSTVSVSEIIVDDCKKRYTGAHFQMFPKQSHAQEYKSMHGSHIPLFAQDKTNGKGGGSKTYAPANYEQIFERVRTKYSTIGRTYITPAFYEIMESDRPSNVFFDLEYDTESNPNLKPIAMLTKFTNDMKKFMDLCNITNDTRKVAEMLALYSVNPTKTSFHLHMIGNNWVLKNHLQCGSLLRNFVMWTIQVYGPHNSDTNPYFVNRINKAGHNEKRFFADIGIYTNNRAFRTYASSKNGGFDGKTPLLKISEWQKIGYDPSKLIHIVPDETTFLKSLPLYIEKPGKYEALTINNPDNSPAYSTNFGAFYLNQGRMDKNARAKPIEFDGKITDPVVDICTKIVYEHINNECSVYAVSHSKAEKLAIIGTKQTRCTQKELRTGVANHISNHLYFIVNYMTGILTERCQDEFCTGKITTQIPVKWMSDIMKAMDPDDYLINDEKLLQEMRGILQLFK